MPPPTRRGWVAVVAAALAAVGVWAWQHGSEGRAIDQMSPERRAELYRAVRREAEALCASEALADRCRVQIELLTEFPECDADCQLFVARHRPRAVR